jgi:uncharacterized protein (DUF302 family)
VEESPPTNPQQAKKVLEQNMEIPASLPCRISV